VPSKANANPDFVQACRRPGFPTNPYIYDIWSGTSPPISPPFWLKLTRIGGNYATYRSSDGVRWCPIQDTAGSAFTTTNAFQAGFFISGGGSAATASAVIDSISLGAPRREYVTSWVGNSFSNDVDRFVSSTISALWVGADGRCYTNTYYDEAGEAAKIYSTDGHVIRSFTDNSFFGNNNVSEGSVTSDGQYIYLLGNRDNVNHNDRPYRTDLDGNNTQPITFTSTIGRIGGMAAGNGKIFFSDVDNNQIWIANATTLSQVGSFAFTRPGPMAMDGRGDLWIIQRATEYPNASNFLPKYPAAILCYHPDGTFTGKQITDVVNPSALCVDPNQDRLLVCENGPDQDIHIYTGLANASPTLNGTFGSVGGLFTGGTLGLLNDPGSGGYTRLYGPNGVGLDAAGNLYVSCSGIGSHLRKFNPNGNLLWSLSGLPFTQCPDFDPTTDGQDLYWQNAHYTLDYTKTTPGSEWSYTGLSWNPFGPDSQGRSDGGTVFRRFGPNNDRFMFVMPAKGGAVFIYRYGGELAIPCGRVGASDESTPVWVDLNGDGHETPDEDSQATRFGGFPTAFDVDSKGDLYILRDYTYNYAAGNAIIRHFHCQGVNTQGVPLYSADPSAYDDEPIPAQMAFPQRFRYDAANDTMYLLGYQAQIMNGTVGLGQWALACYPTWSQPNHVARFFRLLPSPDTDPNFFYFNDPAHGQSYPSGDGFQYYAMDAVGGMIFLGELWGPIHVYDAHLGNPVTRLLPGAEVSGVEGWTDIFGGIRAFQRSTGEYVVVREDAGYRARNLMFRWTPQATAAPQPPMNRAAEGGSDRIRLTWDGGFGLVRKYAVWRGLGPGTETLLADNLTAAQYNDTAVQFGVPYYYRVTASNEAGTSGFSNEVTASAHTAVTFGGSDSSTQGSWKGVYGSQGHTIVGDSSSYRADIQVAATGHTPYAPPNFYTWAPATTDPRALQKASGTDRIAAMWNEGATPPKLQIDLNLTDGRPHQVAIYCLDWDSPGLRQTQIDLYDDLGKRLDSETAAQFQNGKYLVWTISGHVQFVFTPNQYGLGISGLFIDPVASYTITDLGTVAGGIASQANGIDGSGRIVGTAALSDTHHHAFLWNPSGPTMTDLGVFGGTDSYASGINDLGQIAGWHTGSDGSQHAYLYQNGSWSDLGFSGGGDSFGEGVNNLGHVAGAAKTGTGAVHAFWFDGTTVQDLNNFGFGGSQSHGAGINDNDHVAGDATIAGDGATNAFFWPGSGSNLMDLGTLGGANSAATALNQFDQVVGMADTAAGANAFIWDDLDGIMGLGTLGGATSVADGINNNGQVVGGADTPNGPSAFVWDSINGMQDLNTLLPSGSGWRLTAARAINDNGQIAGVGTINGATHAFLLNLIPTEAISAVTVNPAAVAGGNSATGTVTLSLPAPAGGAFVALFSGDPAVTVPASVLVPAGANSATFPVTTSVVPSDDNVLITASYNGAAQAAVLTVQAATPASLTLTPASVIGGAVSTATVTLTGPAPAGGLTLTTTSDNMAVATVPASVIVPAGQTSTSFTVTTVSIAVDAVANISAAANGASQSAALTVKAPTPAKITLQPSSVIGGTASTATVTISGPAPTGGLTLTTASSNTSAATVTGSVTVPAGQTSTTFTVTSIPTAANATASISASYNGVTQMASLTVQAPTPTTLALNPSSVVGGTVSTATVTINGPAPAGGLTLATASTNTAVATVTGSVVVPAGQTSATFTVTSVPTGADAVASISAADNGVTQSASLTVKAPTPTTLVVSPASVIGGTPAAATVTINGPAPAGGLSLTTASGNTSVATVLATFVVPAGQTSATFTVTSIPTAANATAGISASYNGVTQMASLTVQAPTPTAVALNPGTVSGGVASTGTLTTSGPAPAGGLSVPLTSNNGAATVPASVTVAAGKTTASFSVATTPVVADASATITASYNGGSRSAALTIKAAQLLGLSFVSATTVQTITSIKSGQPVRLKIILTSATPAGGAIITPLTSTNNKVVPVPSSATVPAGQTTLLITITTGKVNKSTPVTVSGTWKGVSKSATITVTP
jgi:probable HAF family extracellular repeat protein